MRILVAGATGALGKQLVPRLVAGGHDVTGMTRSDDKRAMIRGMGAHATVADALDAEAVARAVAQAEPEVIVHQLTALSGAMNARSYRKLLEATNRLRIEGTDHLLAAGRAVGVRTFVAQSYCGSGMPFARTGGPVKTETDSLDPEPAGDMRPGIEALRHLENAVTGADWTEGVVLRYGGFYGPGTSLARGGEHFELIRKRKMPVIGSGAGIWSFVHIEDAADATVIAIERGKRGIYNIVDDDPAAVRSWLPAAAAALGARKPLHVPRWLGRLVAGEGFADDDGGARRIECEGEARARLAAAHPSWREGFVEAAR